MGGGVKDCKGVDSLLVVNGWSLLQRSRMSVGCCAWGWWVVVVDCVVGGWAAAVVGFAPRPRRLWRFGAILYS